MWNSYNDNSVDDGKLKPKSFKIRCFEYLMAGAAILVLVYLIIS